MDYPRSAPSYFTSALEISGFRRSYYTLLRTHPPSRLSAVSEDLPRSRVGFHGSLVQPSASGRVTRFWRRRNDNFGQTVFVIRFSPVADVLCSSAISKINPAFAHTLARPPGSAFAECSLRKLRFLRCIFARRGTNPPDGNRMYYTIFPL